MATRVQHPVFARIYARVAKAAQAKGAAEHRDACVSGVTGRVIEVGALSAHAAPKILGVARRP